MKVGQGGWWAVYFDLRDWWVGVYISDTAVYLCPLPCLVIRRMRGPAVSPPEPPPPDPDLDAIRWLEDPDHGPSRPRRLSCSLAFWRPCPHRQAAVPARRVRSRP